MTGAAPTTWVDLPAGTGFGPTHLPYGVFAPPGAAARCGVRIGDQVLDLGSVSVPHGRDFTEPALNTFLARGPRAWAGVRERVTELLTEPSHRDTVAPHLYPVAEVTSLLPWQVADYVDFYSSEQHARNVGTIFRPDAPDLPPNWRWLPIGYHGRSGTVVVSGTPVVRPCGQRRPGSDADPDFGPSRRLDIEAEVGFVVGVPSVQGARVPASALPEHVFGVVLLDDWSARDVQAWEYQPLGPFLGKSFATSVTAWVTPLAALAAARVPPPEQDPPPLAYLHDPDPWALDLALEVELEGTVVSRPPFASMYWTPGQQLAHMTANGASLRTGDLFASGTVTGPAPNQRGSLLELSWGGRPARRMAPRPPPTPPPPTRARPAPGRGPGRRPQGRPGAGRGP
ncbi:MAG: fumarylacetoacetate hydrolase family protein [Actinomycetes bacterium]